METKMQLSNPFNISGKWFKGNTHSHTTSSDGALAPDKLCSLYAASGYDFLFITDHDKLTDIAGLSNNCLAVFPGEEMDVGITELGYSFHIVALGIKQGISCGAIDARQAIDAVIQQNGVAIIAHPAWSQLTVGDMRNLHGAAGFEIYNTSCEYSIGKGHAEAWWNELLARGSLVWGVAADDVHYHQNEHRPVDACGAWIMVKVESLTLENVLKAVKNGNFYASNGPEIKDVIISKDRIRVESSPVKYINFIAQQRFGERFTASAEQSLNGAEYILNGNEKFIRIECIDFQGKNAWTNPVCFK